MSARLPAIIAGLVCIGASIGAPPVASAATAKVLVRFERGTTTSGQRVARVASTGALPVHDIRALATVAADVPTGGPGRRVLRALRALDGVTRVESDGRARAMGYAVSAALDPPSIVNDVLALPGEVLDAGALATGPDLLLSQQWGLATIRAERAWGAARGSEAQLVAVVDSGVDYAHLDLAGKVVKGRDWASGDDDPADPLLNFSHGTHVAGIAAARTGNLLGIAGTAPNVRILAIRVLGVDNSGTYSNIASGIVEAADAGAAVINLSLGGPAPSTTLRDAVAYAVAKGSFVVCATGNDARASVSYPAAYDGCFAVGAITSADERAQFSNTGTGIDLVAPGTGILSLAPPQLYVFADGTSMATPFVAGAAALLASRGMGPAQIADRLASTAVDLGPRGYDTSFGWGRLDVAAAVGAEPRLGDTGSSPQPSSSPSPAREPSSVRLSLWRATQAWKRTACGARAASPCRVTAAERVRVGGVAAAVKRTYAGRYVSLRIDSRRGGRWTTVARARVRAGANGSFRYATALPPGSFRVRASTPGSSSYRAATSAFRYLTVTKPTR